MHEKLKTMRKLVNDFELFVMENGFFMVTFDNKADRAKVKEGGALDYL
jgi:hypothetical protein